MATLADFCTEQNKIGSSYYSDTYTALMTYDGERRPWNIIHISIPFSKEKELALRARFGLAEDELADFYTKFARNVKRSLDIQEALAEMTAQPGHEDLQKATLIAKKIVVTKKDSGGSDIYLLTDEAVPITKSAIIYNDTISIRNIYNLGARLLQSIKLYAKAGICIGSYDLDELYVVEQDGRQIIKYAGFLTSVYKGAVPEYTVDISIHLPAEVRSGEVPPSLGSDIYSLCSLIWTLLSDSHYTDPPDLTAAPQYASPEAVELLRKGMTEREGAIRDLANGFRALAKESQGQKIFPAPAYMPVYQSLLEKSEKSDGSAETGGASPEDEQGGKSGRKPLPPVTKKAIRWTAALAASFAISFMAGKIIGSAGLIPIAAAAQEPPAATASAEVTAEPSPTVAPESASPEPTATTAPTPSSEPTETPTPTPAPTEAPTPQPTQRPPQRPAYTPAPRPEYPQYPAYTEPPVYTPAPTPPPPVPTPPPSTPAPTLPPTPMPSIAFEFEQYEPVIELGVGGSYRIYPTLSCWWDISDRSVVSVTTSAFGDGTTGCEIQALAPGSCTVTAVCTDQDHYGERISVTVNVS